MSVLNSQVIFTSAVIHRESSLPLLEVRLVTHVKSCLNSLVFFDVVANERVNIVQEALHSGLIQ